MKQCNDALSTSLAALLIRLNNTSALLCPEPLALKLSSNNQGKHSEKVSVFKGGPFFRLNLVITWPPRRCLSVPRETGSSSRVDKIGLSCGSARGLRLLSLFWIHLIPMGMGKRTAAFSVPLYVSPAPLLSFSAQRHRQRLSCQWKWMRVPAPSSPRVAGRIQGDPVCESALKCGEL